MSGLEPFLGIIIGLIFIAARRIRKVKRIFVTDYQQGLRFVRGVFREQVGPGSYMIAGTRQQIEIVDLRPHPVIIHRLNYQDAWQNNAMVTMYLEILVSDARLATTMLKNRVDDSLPAIRAHARSVLSRSITEESPGFITKIALNITATVNQDLAHTGMKIGAVEILEFWSQGLALDSKGLAQ